MHWWYTENALMLGWWCADDALVMHWWCTDDAFMMHSWCTDDALMMHWWCTDDAWVSYSIFLNSLLFKNIAHDGSFHHFIFCLCLCLCLCLPMSYGGSDVVLGWIKGCRGDLDFWRGNPCFGNFWHIFGEIQEHCNCLKLAIKLLYQKQLGQIRARTGWENCKNFRQ